jgi:hypothetical protein
MKLRGIFYNTFVGIVGGSLIFMGMLMFNAVLSLLIPTNQWTMLILLCFTSLIVGMLARLMQPFHGLGTALASGIVGALLILYLWLASKAGVGMGLVFGPVGMLVTVLLCTFGGWVFPRLRKPTRRPSK